MTREQYENWKRERALTIKRRRRKITTIVVALMLVVGTTIGTTVAWLTDSSETVTDTFTYGKVDIELYQGNTGNTKWKRDGSGANNVFTVENDGKIVPGASIPYNPYLEVASESEDSFLFVKIDYSSGCFNLALSGNWKAVPNTTGVYYYDAPYTNGSRLQIISSDNVTVKTSVTMGDINDWMTGEKTPPTITITAYAIQSSYLNGGNAATPDVAWNILQTQINSQP